MPKRIIDGEALWTSKKIATLPLEMRAEYANLLPLALANGSFECDPRLVWHVVYSYNRPDVTVEYVGRILDALEASALLLRWEQDGKSWGYWVGIDKPGRLPSIARQNERHERLGPLPPKNGGLPLVGHTPKPEPKPMPEPKPKPEPRPKPRDPIGSLMVAQQGANREPLVPCHVGGGIGVARIVLETLQLGTDRWTMEAVGSAVDRLTKRPNYTQEKACQFLIDAYLQWKSSAVGSASQMATKTWFNDSRFNDDPQSWEGAKTKHDQQRERDQAVGEHLDAKGLHFGKRP